MLTVPPQSALNVLRPPATPGSGPHPRQAAISRQECRHGTWPADYCRRDLYVWSGGGPTVRAVSASELTSHADYYTLNAVGQDDFEDVKVPEAPRKLTAAK